MKILIDVMGADNGLGEIVTGSLNALKKIEYTPIFVGPEDQIRPLIPENLFEKIEIIDAQDVITNEDRPATAIRRKKDSSMVKAFNALKDGKANGMISTGNTGALLAGASLIIGRIENIDRAAITLISPGLRSNTIMLDVGANMDISPELMVQFAKMGRSYAKVLFQKDDPSVGILNIGVEEGKGNNLCRETYDLFKNESFNFIGNIEPYDLLDNDADVLVTDGFAGNIALKSVEGTAKTILSLLKSSISKSLFTKIGGALLASSIKEAMSSLDLDGTGAAPLLGSKQAVFKAHGSSNSRQIEVGIMQIIKFIEADVIADIKANMEQSHE